MSGLTDLHNSEICHRHVSFDRSVKTDRISRRKSYPYPSISKISLFGYILTIHSSEIAVPQERKKNHSSFPPIHTVLSGVSVQKPLSLYFLKRPGSQGLGSVWG